MSTIRESDLHELREQIVRLRGNPDQNPDASIVIPVNAQGDLDSLFLLVGDIANYRGQHTIEVVPVINNYPPDNPPTLIETFRGIGLNVVSLPNARRPGEKVGFSARIPGLRAARSNNSIHFDADCRLPNPTALINYYVRQIGSGAVLAYTPVDFYDVPEGLAPRLRLVIHHTTRWVKRNLLHIPTARGSNYAISRSLMLQLYDTGKLTEDFQIGPNVKATGGRYAHSSDQALAVLTSGRKFRKSGILKYVRWRFLFNLRVLRDNAAARSLKRS